MILDYLMFALALFAMVQGVLRLWMLTFEHHKARYAAIYICIILGASMTLFWPKEGAAVLLAGICLSLAMSRRSWLVEPPPAARK